MFITKLKRVIRSGFIGFWRNGFVSFTSILVMSVILFVIGFIGFVGITLNSSLQEIKSKVDINVYFQLDAPESSIMALKSNLEKIPEVAAVEYTSRQQALEDFRRRHATETDLLNGLDELGDNPLPASLNIKAREPSQYEQVANFLDSDAANQVTGGRIIDKINYQQNKVAIDKLSQILASAKTIGLVAGIVLALVSILVTFSTIRLAIYSSREEISVMQLVGASSAYIRMPFVVEGVLIGLISSIISLILYYPLTYWLGPIAEKNFGSVDLFAYYVGNFGAIFLIVCGLGIILGSISSYLAVRRYLKI